jgi:hypothetical protein
MLEAVLFVELTEKGEDSSSCDSSIFRSEKYVEMAHYSKSYFLAYFLKKRIIIK